MGIRPYVEEFLGCGATAVSCEDVRRHVQSRVDLEVSATSVSRVIGNLGWVRFMENGKVCFRQPGPQNREEERA